MPCQSSFSIYSAVCTASRLRMGMECMTVLGRVIWNILRRQFPVVVLEALAALLEDSPLAATPLARVMKTVPACGELFRTALHDTSPQRRFFSAKILVHLHLSKAMNLERELTTTVLPVLLGLLQMSCFSWHEEAWARFGIYHDRRASPQCPHLEEAGELLAKLLDNSPPLQRVAFELDAIPALVNALQHTREVLFACPGSLLTKENKRSRLRLDRRPTPTTVLGVAGSSEKISDRTQRHIMAVLRAMAFIASDVEQARRILVDNELLDLLMELLDSARRAPKETTSGVVEATARVLASLLTSVHNRRRKGLHPGLVEHLLALAVDASAPLTVRFAACDALVQCSMPKCTLRSVLLDQQRGISRLMPIFRSCIHGWEASQGDQITNLGVESNGAWRATRMHGVRTQTSTSPFRIDSIPDSSRCRACRAAAGCSRAENCPHLGLVGIQFREKSPGGRDGLANAGRSSESRTTSVHPRPGVGADS
ncbi:hypothetical protein F1559_002909 [Cyanidiococcus yangmingshanensis]|uniref:Uncharacterized protein n=1 Tax=Cyanidiococcus yangmingshanensis TaxID=2690220 RepID=A0A7J7IJN1_9RHOD|nr:hypothetical protein F1559_002909 [Cyanidiococcus yangmingshanensis]